MSILSASMIPKPADEQAFERACTILWQGLLKTPSVQRNGRRGQRQRGVDLFGYRDCKPTQLVGIQCKLKGPGKELTEDEVRHEVGLALTFAPPLQEYFIVTTAPDDEEIQALARLLTLEQHQAGRNITIAVWGWNTLEERIAADADARKIFDPSYTPFAEKLSGEIDAVRVQQIQIGAQSAAQHEQILFELQAVQARLTGQVVDSTAPDALEAELDANIDNYRGILTEGHTTAALTLLSQLLKRVENSASGRILFRVKANIAACLIAQGDDESGAELLLEAYGHASDEPKAIANKALALLIQQKNGEALTFGRAALEADPTNEILAGHVVQAACFDEGVEDPLDIIPESLRTVAAVRIAYVQFLRQRDLDQWRDAARAAAEAWPEEPHARQFAAEAELEEILSTEGFQRTRLLSPDQRARIEKAASVLRELWDQNRTKKPQGNSEAAGQCTNLLVALHGLGDLESALAVAREGVSFAPDAPFLRRYAAIIAVESGDETLGAQLIPALSDDPEDLAVAFRFYANRRDWMRLAGLSEKAVLALPPSEVMIADTLGRLANLKVSLCEDMAKSVAAVLEGCGDDPRAAIVVADFAMDEGLTEVAEEAFLKATGLVTEDSHIARRQMVAGMALRRGNWAVVADMLDGHIDHTRDSGEMRMLAAAFVNESPIKQRGLRFFLGLPPDLAANDHYRRAMGLFHFNRGALKQAEQALRRTVAESDDLLSYLALFETLRRLRRADEIGPIIDKVDVRTLCGSASEKMAFAQAWRDAGHGDQAISFAYEILTGSPDDAKAALGYFGLVMLDPRDKLIPWPKKVELDTWVRLEGNLGERADLLIVASGARPAASIVTPSHPLASQAMGLAVGDKFVVKGGVTGDHEWRIAEIKHKYLHALHDIMENFETRFPDEKGIWRTRMRDGDIQPALDMIKRAAEADRACADVYLVHGIPLNMVATRVTGSPLGFADYLRRINKDISTTLGNQKDRDLAIHRVRNRRNAGAVLDTYAAWTVASMGAIDTLTSIFGPLAIAQTTADELEQVRQRVRPSDQAAMTIGWYDGQFVREDLSSEEARAHAAQVDKWINDVLTRFEVLPTVAPDDLNPVGVAVLEQFGSHVLDAAFAAGTERILVSEDRHFRSAAEGILGATTVWLQPVFTFARDEGLITPATYADYLLKLAWRQHGHVAADVSSMLEILKADDTSDLGNFSRICRYLGGPRAEMRSHTQVSADFINLIWSDSTLAPLKVMKATDIVLTALIKEPSRDWATVLAAICLCLSSDARLYTIQWISGHFLSQTQFRAAEAELINSLPNKLRRHLSQRSPFRLA